MDLTFHCVLCSPKCTDALTAESWYCLNLELNSICTCPQARLLSANNFNAGSGSTFRTAFAYAIRLTSAVHNAERYAFSSDFVDGAALMRFWAATSTITRVVAHAMVTRLMSSAWGLGEDDRNPSQTLGLSHFPLVAANGVLHDLSP